MHVGRELDDDTVLDEVVILGVLVHVKAGRVERLLRLPQAVRVVQVDDGAEAIVQPVGKLLLHGPEARHVCAAERQQRGGDEERGVGLLVGVVAIEGLRRGEEERRT